MSFKFECLQKEAFNFIKTGNNKHCRQIFSNVYCGVLILGNHMELLNYFLRVTKVQQKVWQQL